MNVDDRSLNIYNVKITLLWDVWSEEYMRQFLFWRGHSNTKTTNNIINFWRKTHLFYLEDIMMQVHLNWILKVRYFKAKEIREGLYQSNLPRFLYGNTFLIQISKRCLENKYSQIISPRGRLSKSLLSLLQGSCGIDFRGSLQGMHSPPLTTTGNTTECCLVQKK